VHLPQKSAHFGGDGGIRTLDRPLQAYNGLANRRLQPLGHVSNKADMPEPAARRKRQMCGFGERLLASLNGHCRRCVCDGDFAASMSAPVLSRLRRRNSFCACK
jgi:hypothetical protein